MQYHTRYEVYRKRKENQNDYRYVELTAWRHHRKTLRETRFALVEEEEDNGVTQSVI